MIMRSRSLFVLFALVVLFLFQCGKKEKKKEEVVARPETITVEVEIPEVSWEKSLAVLPLEMEHVSPEDEVIPAVMTEEIVSNLSRSKKLKVLPPSSADWIDQSDTQTDYLLKGRVAKSDDRYKTTLTLVDAQNDSILWSETYENEAESVLTVSENAARTVARTLGESVAEKELKPPSPQIVSVYLEAKSYLAQGTRESTDLAVQKFKEVLRQDSTFALAHVGLAESYLLLIQNQWEHNPVWLRLAQDASRKAVQANPDLAEGYLQSGRVYMTRGDFKHGEKEFRRALFLNPNSEEAWTGLGQVFIHYGLYEPCLEVYEKTLALNPANGPVSLSRAMILIGLKRYAQSEAEIQRTLRYHPDKSHLYSFLALAHYYQGDLNQALKDVQIGMQSETYRPLSHAVLAMIYAKQGKLDAALGELELEVKPYVRTDASLATAVAAIYALVKQNGQAVQWLQKALSLGYREYPWLVNDPNFEDLRTDERFVNLMKEMKRGWEEKMKRYSSSESRAEV